MLTFCWTYIPKYLCVYWYIWKYTVLYAGDLSTQAVWNNIFFICLYLGHCAILINTELPQGWVWSGPAYPSKLIWNFSPLYSSHFIWSLCYSSGTRNFFLPEGLSILCSHVLAMPFLQFFLWQTTRWLLMLLMSEL